MIADVSEARKRGQQAGLATRKTHTEIAGRVGVPNGYVEWHIPLLERVTAQQFEQILVDKFGADYLEPVDYHWVDGVFCPVKACPEQSRRTVQP